MSKKKPRKSVYLLYTNKGEVFGTYNSKKEADEDVAGPAFRPTYSICTYELTETEVREYGTGKKVG